MAIKRKNLSDALKIEVLKNGGSLCHICGFPFFTDPSALVFDPPEIDHIIPVSKGGQNSIENLALAHRSCNRAKKDGRKVACYMYKSFAEGRA